MIFAIDVGNTNTVVALYDGDVQRQHWRLSTDKNRSSDEFGMLFVQFLRYEGVKESEVKDVIISSVVPPVMHSLNNAARKYLDCKPIVIGPGVKTGLNIRYDNPKEVGADRIVNAVAAVHKYAAPVIVVDFGTATTFCVVDEKGDYLGGIITAGIKISMDALFERAAKLPKVEIAKPDCVVGRNTVASMQSGAVFGHAGQVDALVGRIKSELNLHNAKIVATGGLAGLIAGESNTIEIVDRMLTLDGLRIIYDKNR